MKLKFKLKPFHIDPVEYEKTLRQAFADQAAAASAEAFANGDEKQQQLVPFLKAATEALVPIYVSLIDARNNEVHPDIVATMIVTVCADLVANCASNLAVEQEQKHQFAHNMVRGVSERAHMALETPPAFVSKAREGGTA